MAHLGGIGTGWEHTLFIIIPPINHSKLAINHSNEIFILFVGFSIYFFRPSPSTLRIDKITEYLHLFIVYTPENNSLSNNRKKFIIVSYLVIVWKSDNKYREQLSKFEMIT